MEIKTLEDCTKYLRERLEALRPIFAKATIGDFSQDIPNIEKDDEFAELFFGIQTMLEVIRDKVSSLEMEIGQRHEVEQRLISKNQEQALAQKAMLNVLDDLQKAKAVTEQEEAKYEALLGSIGDGIVATNNTGSIIFANDTAEKLLGWSGEELLDRNMTEAIPAEDKNGKLKSDSDRVISQVMEGKSISITDDYYLRKDKSKFPVAVNARPIMLGRKVVGAVLVFRDITKEKELDKAKSDFISIASHQLRTPVTAMKWLNEISQSVVSKLTPKEQSYFKDLSSSIERMSKLVEDLLNVSRIELGTKKEEKIVIDLSNFIKDFLSDQKSYALAKDHEIVFTDNFTGAFVEIDSKMLYNVLQNLVSNAIDYSPPGRVQVVIDSEKSDVKVSVSNTGPIIPKEEQRKLFQKFYRGESTKKMKTEGTGLGLYIVKSNIESAGGTTGFISEKGKGNIFWFTLPVKK